MAMRRFPAERNRRKFWRVVVQVLILAAIGVGLYYLIRLPYREAEAPKAQQPSPSIQVGEKMQREDGFIAISYFGVAEEATETVISQTRLREHLQALHDLGYVTISQQDVYDYYYNGGSLPEKALFLFFEDGLKRSAMLAQPILESLGYQASMLCYANNLEENDGFFLSTEDLIEMKATGYWEIGVNGYRLSYINVFDIHDNYLGELTPEEYRYVSPYLRRVYNHYLMDYIRDKYSVPMETQAQMAQRVENDYRMMEAVYTAGLGELPMLYTLMHSNTDQFATNDQVSIENERWISGLFALNFNREMLCRNGPEVNPLDLTRMQPQAYWSVNHLLMRIADDTNTWQDVFFVTGDAERAAEWDILRGAAQWDGDTIRVTTLPEEDGVIRLRGSESLRDFYLGVSFDGNLLGRQSVHILADAQGNDYTAIELAENVLYVYTAAETVAQEPLFTLDLDVLDGFVYQTMEENRQEALAVEIDVKRRQVYKPEDSLRIVEDLLRAQAKTDASNNGPYKKEVTLKDDGSRYVEIVVLGDKLYVSIDGKTAVSGLELTTAQGGGLALGSYWFEYGYSQRNLADDVYDADFRELYLSTADGEMDIIDYRAQEVAVVEQIEEPVVLTGWQRLKNWLGMEEQPAAGKE